ncbi:MAG: PPC domain-containing protein, partial [Phototrophicaceae bacterium]
PANGTYSINARGFSSTARGVYTLTLTSGGGQIIPSPVPGSGTISYGETVTGDLQNDEGDRWTFTGSAGDIVTIALDSDDFDAYLELFDAADNVLTSDDDGGGSLNSLITGYALPADGTYTILARGFGSSARGAYTLSLSLFDASTLDEPGMIAYGDMVQALLSDDEGDRWTFAGAQGDVISIALNSDAFDSFVELLDADGNVIASDDDSGGSLNSLISGFTLPAKADYTIVARPLGTGSGLYTLELSQVDPSLLQSSGVVEQGVLTNGTATTIGQRWTYNGTAGERISVLVGGETDMYLELLGPDGVSLFDTQDSYNWGHALFDDVELPVDGEYTLIVRARRAEEWSDGNYVMIVGRPAPPQE